VLGLFVASAASADVSLDGVPGRIGDCAAVLHAELARRYPGEYDEHYCEKKTVAGRVEIACYGACTDRSCHTDACLSHEGDVDVTLELRRAAPTPWTRTRPAQWQIRYDRSYGDVAARIADYGEGPTRRLPPAELRRLERAIDACLASR
jgi:hypothetical protein